MIFPIYLDKSRLLSQDVASSNKKQIKAKGGCHERHSKPYIQRTRGY